MPKRFTPFATKKTVLAMVFPMLVFTSLTIDPCRGESNEPPNIVLMIADDMAWNDCGAFGNQQIRTPHLNQLAREGLCFEHAYLTISSCSPSRASLITGKYPHKTDADELHWPLPKEQTTFVEKLRAAGYWAGAAGKWHLGREVRDRFDKILEVDTSGFQLPAGQQAAGGKFQESAVGDAKSGCADWVTLLRERPRNKPFFLWLAAVDPHRPYDPQISDAPHSVDQVQIPPYHPNTPSVREDYARYYDEITRLDRFVGDVLAELDRQEVQRNTIVIFMSDNGRPFPRDKTTLYDSGIRTPLIIRWPSRIAANSRSQSLVSSVDLAPTLLHLAGATAPSGMDGNSFHPVLSDPSHPHREFIFAEKNWHDFEDHARTARSRRFKYIRNSYPDLPNTPPADAVRSPTYQEMLRLHQNNGLNEKQLQCFTAPRAAEELYDVDQDPHETRNLANSADHQMELRRHRHALDHWRKETGDRLPEMRTADEFDRVTGKPTPARRRPRWSKKQMVEAGLTAP